ncbi:MAG: hypothetical protein JXR63_06805 [Spirochaetales bacterium]|nr:hypothetical protein [Spirochaetales bacterium]
MYKIQEYVIQTMKDKDLSKSQLASRLGYKNISGGTRRVHEFLTEFKLNDFLIKNLHRGLDVPFETIQQKLLETKLQQDKEIEEQNVVERKNFSPFIYCQAERRIPSPIFAAALMRSTEIRILPLPRNFNTLDAQEQSDIIQDSITEILSRYNRTIPAFGLITAFTLCRKFDEKESQREVYNLEGEIIPSPSPELQMIRYGRCTFSAGSNDISRFIE